MSLARAAAACLPALLAAAGLDARAQTLFKCVQANGRVSYQSEPCAPGTRGAPVRIEDPSPPSRPAQDTAAPATPSGTTSTPGNPAPPPPPIPMERMIGILANYQGCAEGFPSFAAKHRPRYEQWRQRHQASLSRYEQDGEARRKVREAVEYDRRAFLAENAEARAARADTCERNIAPLLGADN